MIYTYKRTSKKISIEYIEVFVVQESHSANNNLSPVEFEERQNSQKGNCCLGIFISEYVLG